MATIKHISSKNADYGAAEAYLTFEHDEFTMKPTLDEAGRLIPRQDYRLDTLNCGDEDFALSCIRANLRYGKNSKREDIINWGNGFIVLELTASDPEGNPAGGELTVAVDGVSRTIRSGSRVQLRPGESICLPPRTIHQFWGEGGNGLVIDGVKYGVSGEVSSVCDDRMDNVFIRGGNRFPALQEDEPRHYYLCQEYPPAAPEHDGEKA